MIDSEQNLRTSDWEKNKTKNQHPHLLYIATGTQTKLRTQKNDGRPETIDHREKLDSRAASP